MNVICIDVGSPKNIGWANDRDQTGSALTLTDELHRAGRLLLAGERVALGFEAPIWTPRRTELERITASRGGVEKSLNRAWSAGAGCGALGAALALMPWCFATLRETSGSIAATTDPVAFSSGVAPLFIWEAFVSGAAKALLHHEDAALAVKEYLSRDPLDPSDVPVEAAMNHAAAALRVAGFIIQEEELGKAGLVICVQENRAKSSSGLISKIRA
jgi:hypothetical protein